MKYPSSQEVQKRCAELTEQYEIDDSMFDQIIAHWDEKQGTVEERLTSCFQALLKQVSEEMAKMDNHMSMAPSCQLGCAFCCYFPIIVTELEAKLIIHSIQQLSPKRSEAIKTQLQNYQTLHRDKLDTARQIDFKEDEQFKLKYRQLNLPCPLLNLETNTCMAYEVRPTPCRTYINYMDPKLCANQPMPKETVSFEFLYLPYFEALNEFLQWLYEDEDTSFINYPDDLFTEDYLINWLPD
ncbi:Putative zinc-or iron-chelating domain-containing protein [Amphibacillus marinus]|uniref:Putative zinc-or iron-chelating domain-containing protein n=1 Tax=Amphibacillus marinus TaxID=872970 RepID=A0A1H8IJS8_9BACI|nr:YkgJ family cysteine cluster protein [Amphibacillus marinus]SEN68923.1 Putative zinc-or iron-chelating domain-containing protein [Amphibacillus marinus]